MNVRPYGVKVRFFWYFLFIRYDTLLYNLNFSIIFSFGFLLYVKNRRQSFWDNRDNGMTNNLLTFRFVRDQLLFQYFFWLTWPKNLHPPFDRRPTSFYRTNNYFYHCFLLFDNSVCTRKVEMPWNLPFQNCQVSTKIARVILVLQFVHSRCEKKSTNLFLKGSTVSTRSVTSSICKAAKCYRQHEFWI